jgi:hypothetical protein
MQSLVHQYGVAVSYVLKNAFESKLQQIISTINVRNYDFSHQKFSMTDAL